VALVGNFEAQSTRQWSVSSGRHAVAHQLSTFPCPSVPAKFCSNGFHTQSFSSNTTRISGLLHLHINTGDQAIGESGCNDSRLTILVGASRLTTIGLRRTRATRASHPRR
jgi:hypothetical protein